MLARIMLAGALIVAALASGRPEAYQWDLPKGFPRPRVPAANPMSEVKALLGRYLFYDKRLSINGTSSCATCHRQELAFTDGRPNASGATGMEHPRSAMSLVNVAYSDVLTWSDPKLRSLESQALIPMFSEHPLELGLKGREAAVLDMLRADASYGQLFPKAFPGVKEPFTISNVAKALATFERTILSARSPYDRYYYGGDQSAISDAAKRGEALFFTNPVAGCFRCHGGFNFSDTTRYEGSESAAIEFHNTSLYDSYPAPNRGVFEHTKNPADLGKFKAPTLRNIALTAPYMHDGSIRTLAEVLDHYAAGGRAQNPNKDQRMTRIALTDQNRKDLLAFLESLTDTEVIHDKRFSNPW